MRQVKKVVVCGGGTAGLISALTLKRKLPQLEVTVVRSKKLGVIGVGEGTIASFNEYLFRYLGLNVADFYRSVKPTWKLGIKFNWGRRGSFNYCFDHSCDWTWADQTYANGFYCQADFKNIIQASALMDRDRVFVRKQNGDPLIHEFVVYHLENVKFVEYLERQNAQAGVALVDAIIERVELEQNGLVGGLVLDTGERLAGDLYIDASGFKSMLLGNALEAPFDSFSDSLFCDRALVGRWDRQSEVIRPYTTSDAMEAGWSWRIDHEHEISRGYVYSSHFLSREEAESEFREKNPELTEIREIRFAPGKYRDGWCQNVVAIGNASGFVEPLEATSIGLICDQSRTLARSLQSSHRSPDESIRRLYNQNINRRWESIRGFLALHYQLNDASDNEFWQHCQNETRLGEAIEGLIDHYQRFGPDNEIIFEYLPPGDLFGVDGYLSMLVGFGKSYEHSRIAMTRSDVARMSQRRAEFARIAEFESYDSAQALERVRAADWTWH